MTQTARVLAVCTAGGSGDLLAATPAISALARHFGCKAYVLAAPASASLLEGHPAVEAILVDDGAPIDEMVQRVKRYDFTHAVVFWSTARVAAIVQRAKIPVRVGQSSRLYSFRYTVRVPVRTERGDRTSAWSDVQMDYARALGASPQPDDYRIVIELDERDRAEAGELIASVAPRGRFIVLHATRGMPLDSVRWPVESFARIGDALADAFDAPVLLTGTPSEKPVIERIAAAMRNPNAVIAGQTSLRSLAALLARADVVVALDSGPMHIAAAVGAPTVGIFALRTDLPMRWRPLGERVVVLGPTFPCPVWCRKETCKTFDCYRALDPVRVVESARAAMRMTSAA
ncbi:MAG: glycosyltransferase family 9 protein [Candidatus Eremiobacteraeota bacterium]|nr:glycosyltransferase family 9 protein [Candidatus Eremiobacteraeota bacterium]